MNTKTQTPGTAANKTYTAEELMAAGYAAYKFKTSYAYRSDAQWLMNIAVEMTGPGEVDEDDECEETAYIWAAVAHLVRNQDSALAGRVGGLSC